MRQLCGSATIYVKLEILLVQTHLNNARFFFVSHKLITLLTRIAITLTKVVRTRVLHCIYLSAQGGQKNRQWFN